MDEPILVIDFGTTKSAGILLTGEQVLPLKEPGNPSYSWPSAVFRDGDRLVAGTPAQERGRSRPLCHRASFKAEIGESAAVPLGEDGHTYTMRELVAAVIGALGEEAARLAGHRVNRAVLTVPATYRPGDPRLELMIGAAGDAGLAAVELLPEPTAAALGPVAGEPFADGDLVLVYDFGGGTFDAALVRVGASGDQRVVGERALEGCGGRDVDTQVVIELGARTGHGMGELPNGELYLLLELARRLKHQLSGLDTAEGILDVLGVRLTLDRADFAALTAGLMDRTVDCCRDLLRDCRVEPTELSAVLLVGGSSRMHMVRERLATEFPCRLATAMDPELAVVQGAAQWAKRSASRRATDRPGEHGETPLRWGLPDGGTATLLCWQVEEGADYGEGATLALVRLTSNNLIWQLHARGAGSVRQLHTAPGGRFTSGDWLLTTGPARTASGALPSEAVLAAVRQLGGRDCQVAFGRQGQLFAAAAAGGIRTWDGSGAELPRLSRDGGRGLALHPDGGLLATGTDTGVRVWDTESGDEVLTVPGSEAARVVSFSPDGLLLALWTAEAGVRFVGVEDGKEAAVSYAAQLPGGAFSPGGRLFAALDRGTVSVREVGTGALLHRFRTQDTPSDLAFTPGGRHLYAATERGLPGWDVVTGDLLPQRTDGPGRADRLAFRPDGLLLAVGGRGEDGPGYVELREAATGSALIRLAMREPPVSLAFGPDGRTLGAGTRDGRALCWTLR
ncbi:Hsp70 family protein [Streptomyces phaeochromogenes]|uniref:Hsp70 family protein n=1 Tax=Streptomyces phaeochromogenes TaxID=1923 RepID=UPI0033CB4F6A